MYDVNIDKLSSIKRFEKKQRKKVIKETTLANRLTDKPTLSAVIQ